MCVCEGGGGLRGAQLLGGMGTDNNKRVKINIVQQVQ